MKQADHIRSFIIKSIFNPARAAGRNHVTIRAGDVHYKMGLRNVYPAVCSALRGKKLEQEAHVRFLGQDGPRDGANVLFHYDLRSSSKKAETERRAPARKIPKDPQTLRKSQGRISLSAASLALVSCSKAKLSHPAPARELYSSPAFQMKRAIIEKAGATWVILSAKHGVLYPEETIAPYDLTLNSMGASARREWAEDVLPNLLSIAQKAKNVVIFAGQRYAENLIGPIAEKGIPISQPLRGLRQGEQLAWLSENQ